MRRFLIAGGLIVVLLGSVAMVRADSTSPGSQPAGQVVSKAALQQKAMPAIDKAIKYQLGKQTENGGWEIMPGVTDPAVTAMVAQCLIQHPEYGPKHPAVDKAMEFVVSFQQPDGGIYSTQIGYRNYTTSVVLMSLSSMKSPAMGDYVAGATKYLKDNQWTEGMCDPEGKPITPEHPWYGGAGYGQSRRPDLSNTQMMLEALHQSGLPPTDPAYQKAIQFVLRCQMSERSNDQSFAKGADDGGFIYTPANGGESKAGTVEVNGRPRLRSYGSMTYAGFKSMLYANVDRNDPRVKAAWDWIRRNYTLTSNPNMPGAQSQEGLYYFYHVFAKALEAWGEPVLVDSANRPHDWRADLIDQLIKTQKPDGSWVNEADRWHEGNPSLVTAYAVLAMQTAIK
ncbi:MAG: terpene cyclase/mutase family protein [Phycisphaerae bacterium]|nr:terpene cyclase/mutase family protein [Phycisphaerae bacterium]